MMRAGARYYPGNEIVTIVAFTCAGVLEWTLLIMFLRFCFHLFSSVYFMTYRTFFKMID